VRPDAHRLLLERDDLLDDEFGGTVCASTNGNHPFSVDLNPYTDEKVGKVKVSIELQLPDSTFAIVGSDWSTLSTYTDTTVEVSENNTTTPWSIGFGGSGWSDGNPVGDGSIVWEFTGGQIRPYLTGNLHMESAAGDCVRMRLDYYADDGPDAGTAVHDLRHSGQYILLRRHLTKPPRVVQPGKTRREGRGLAANASISACSLSACARRGGSSPVRRRASPISLLAAAMSGDHRFPDWLSRQRSLERGGEIGMRSCQLSRFGPLHPESQIVGALTSIGSPGSSRYSAAGAG
jgi:hypothetical protein